MSEPIEWTTKREIEVTHTLRVATRDYATMINDEPATPDDLLKRFEAFIAEQCKGRDRSEVRVVVE